MPDPLAVLGFDSLQRRVYDVLLRAPRTSADALALHADCSAGELVRALSGLEDARLVSHDDDGWIVARPPAQALGEILDRQAALLAADAARLDEVRQGLPAFLMRAAEMRPQADITQVQIDMVPEDQLPQEFERLIRVTPGELLWMRPDQWHPEELTAVDHAVLTALAAGRTSRAVYPARVLEHRVPGIHRRAEAGEAARVLARVPMRLAVLGNSVAVLPERLGSEVGRVLIVRQVALVESLKLLFEAAWAQAISVPGLGAHGETAADESRSLLLNQLARGAKDEQIARTLGVSLRTVRRRASDLLGELGATSRFQAGVEAVRRGWL
ncbi:MAG: hypothetical protein QM655_04715 [Nocardioidaceae bacterium]